MSEPYDHSRSERGAGEPQSETESSENELEAARENVFDGWPSSEDVSAYVTREPVVEPLAATVVEPPPRPLAEREAEAAPDPDPAPAVESRSEPEPEPDVDLLPAASFEPGQRVDEEAGDEEAGDEEAGDEEAGDEEAGGDEAENEPEPDSDLEPEPVALVDPAAEPSSHEHAPGELEIPPGYGVLEGEPDGSRRAVGIVVSRFNGDVTSQLLASALDELERTGVPQNAITVMPVPGAFELPIGAMALARTRRFACIVALGCVVRGDTPHFDYVASEAASGLQLAALETGVPVAFGVLTLDRADQAEARIDKGAESVRTALEMADLFSHLRAAAAR